MTVRGGEVVHECVGGFCRVCGDTAEWLRDRGRDRVIECVGFVDVELDLAPLGALTPDP